MDDQDISDDEMRSISAKTMVIVGDADGVTPEHALAMFRLRGGGDEEAVACRPVALEYGTGYSDDGPVIVAVEGPSAAGKTTWCGQQPWPVVDEYAPTGTEPDGPDEHRQAVYWVQVNSGRWQQAVDLERRNRVVLCDSDPLKLHYSWCLARIGEAPWSRFNHELRYAREALTTARLGFTDIALVSIPPLHVLRSRQATDLTRQRRSFDLHARLGEPLREWYTAVELAEPGRVVWSWPTSGVPITVGERPRRCDPALLDRIIEHLPAVSSA